MKFNYSRLLSIIFIAFHPTSPFFSFACLLKSQKQITLRHSSQNWLRTTKKWIFWRLIHTSEQWKLEIKFFTIQKLIYAHQKLQPSAAPEDCSSLNTQHRSFRAGQWHIPTEFIDTCCYLLCGWKLFDIYFKMGEVLSSGLSWLHCDWMAVSRGVMAGQLRSSMSPNQLWLAL